MNKKKYLSYIILALFAFLALSCKNKNVEVKNNEVVDGNKIFDLDQSADSTFKVDSKIYDLAVGMTMPNVKVDTNKGNVFELSKTTKPVLINFWATWCPPCRMEMPGLQSLYEEYGDRIDFVMINLGETKETIQDFLVENEIYTFPIGYDEANNYGDMFSIMAIPTTYIVGKDKVIKNYVIGAREEKQFKEYIEELLK